MALQGGGGVSCTTMSVNQNYTYIPVFLCLLSPHPRPILPFCKLHFKAVLGSQQNWAESSFPSTHQVPLHTASPTINIVYQVVHLFQKMNLHWCIIIQSL